jgi:hypothetical protein
VDTGLPPAGLSATEEYDGSSWTSGGALSPTTWASAGTGTQTAALKMGGAGAGSPGPTSGTDVQEYDGTNWATGGAMLSANKSNQGAGTQTAALTFGGDTPGTPTTIGHMMELHGQQDLVYGNRKNLFCRFGTTAQQQWLQEIIHLQQQQKNLQVRYNSINYKTLTLVDNE